MKRIFQTLLPLSAMTCTLTLMMMGSISPLQAAKYDQATITRVFNEVRILKGETNYRQAEVGTDVQAVSSVATGADSRAELRFPDQSLTRLGANSRFTLRGEGRTLELEQGTMLLQVPKRIGGAKVRTAAVTAAVTGTSVLFEYLPGGFIKLIVIEGTVDLFFNDRPGQFSTVKAGEMIIMRENAKTLPLPVDVDLERLLKTSKLISAEDKEMPNQEQVVQALQTQQQELQQGDLVQTSLVIPGQGTVVQIDGNTRLNVANTIAVREGTSPTTGEVSSGLNPDEEEPDIDDLPDDLNQVPTEPLVSVVINEASTVVTNPTTTATDAVTGEATTVTGRLYRGSDFDGPFPLFAFDDANGPYPPFQEALDGAATPWATFTFESIVINGNPVFTVPEGPNPSRNVVLGAEGDIRLTGNGLTPPGTGILDLSDNPAPLLESLAFYSNMGSIFVGPDFEVRAGTADFFQDLFFVAAGPTSNINIQSYIEVFGKLMLAAYQDILIGPPGTSHEPTDPLLYPNFLDAEANRDLIVSNASISAENIINLAAEDNINVMNSEGSRSLILADGIEVPGQVNFKTGNGDITIQRADIVADQAPIESEGGEEASSESSLTQVTVEVLAHNDVVLSDTTVTARSMINVNSAVGNITIRDSSQLRVLANSLPLFNENGSVAAAQLQVCADSEDVTITGTFGAEEGPPDLEAPSILIKALNNLQLNNIHASAEVLRAHAFGPDGTLTIGGSRLSGNQLLRLYADGANGVVRFIENSHLSGNRIEIAAGNRVEILDGKQVTIHGSDLDIFTPASGRNYNREGFGSFQGEFNLHECEFNNRPGIDSAPDHHCGGGGA
jgi:hypothetical protein